MKTPFKTADRRGRYIISRPVSAKEIIDKAAQLTKQRFRRGKFLQNPKETANVGNNVADMLGNIVHIATEVMKDNKLSINAQEDEISRCIDKLDLATKIKMAAYIKRRVRYN